MPDITSGIYKIDGYRLLAASAQRALGDSDGNDITATYLKKADFTASSGKWENAADVVEANSATWNEVVDKLDTTAFTAFTATADVTPYTAANNYIDITNHGVSGYDWTNTITSTADAASANAVDTVEGKFGYNSNNEITGYNNSAFAGEEYTAGAGIDITNNEISVTGEYVTSATSSMNDKNLVLRNNTWVELQETGAFEVADLDESTQEPDVENPSHKVIYLTKESGSTKTDPYTEWIYTENNDWEIIGETTIDLTNYASTAWVDENYVSTAATGSWDVTEYTGASGINVTGHEIGLVPAYKTAVEDVSSKLNTSDFETWSATIDTSAYSAGSNIDITNHVVSGKDWTTEIEDASANAVTVVGTNFGTSGTSPDQVITGYNGTAFYVPDTNDFVTQTEYEADRVAWDDVVINVSSNSGAWTHEFTMVNVPDLSNVPDITNP